ncbi:MAG TPA: nucleotidyltransferase [Desulfosporosinus sp.]|nr:nucleotidyltransferase [Desulfosporosinus sp.]
MPLSLKQFKPFDQLTENVLLELSQTIPIKTYPKGSFVFVEGEKSQDSLFLILSGVVEIITGNGSGAVRLRSQGEFFGETVILTGKRYPASAKVQADLTCYVLGREIFESLLQNYQEVAFYFNRVLTDRLWGLYEEMLQEQPYESFGLGFDRFKQKVYNIMSTPVETCQPHTPINELARLFTKKKISSMVVTDPSGIMLGLVSERDLISKVLARDSNPSVITAFDIMQQPPPTLTANAFYYQALLTMLKSHGKYIVVTEQARPIGIVTIGDLTRARINSSITIVRDIELAGNISELAQASKQINDTVATMISEKATASEIGEVVSELYDILTRRLLLLAENSMVEKGLGWPPVDYCWLTMGSGGREELTPSSDQDNAIVYADVSPEEEEQIRNYFNELADYVTEGLELCGLIKCPGNIMSTNPEWCRSISTWKNTVHQWAMNPNPDAVRQFTIFLDFRPVYGQEYLAQMLRDYTLHLFRTSPALLHFLATDALSHRVPLNLFKNVILEKNKDHKNEVDLKRSAGVLLVDCIRIFAMSKSVVEVNSLARLKKLVEFETISADDAEYYEAAFQSLMMFRMRENLRKLSLGFVPDNYINPTNLSERERSVMRESFVAVDRLQNVTRVAFQR